MKRYTLKQTIGTIPKGTKIQPYDTNNSLWYTTTKPRKIIRIGPTERHKYIQILPNNRIK